MFNIKKISALILATGILLQPAVTVLAEGQGLLPTDEEEFLSHLSMNYTIGDLNKDYGVTLEDASSVLRQALKLDIPENTYQKFVADATGNGEVTLEDASKVLKMALKIDEVKSISATTQAKGNTKAFIQETDIVKENAMNILTSEDELKQYVSSCSESKETEVLEKYAGIFEEKNLLAVRVQVYTDSLSGLRCYTVIHDKHIMTQIIENEINVADKNYEFIMFMCLDKELTNQTAKLSLENREVTNVADVIAVTGSGEETVDYNEATQHMHLIRNVEELQSYKDFLKNSYQVEDSGLQEYMQEMDKEHFYTHAYVAFTYCKPSGSFYYKVTGMQAEDRVLKIQLEYIDENEPGVPGMKDGMNCVFVKAPVLVLDNVDQVELEVVSK